MINNEITTSEFKRFDKDSSGYLDRKELNKPAKEILITYNKDFSKEEKVTIIDKCFKNLI